MGPELHQSMRDLNMIPDQGTPEAITWAQAAKTRGNDAFARSDFKGAIHHFSQAIKANPSDRVFFSNRSAAYASLNKFEEAAVDAQAAIDVDPTWGKAWLRLGYALFKLDHFQDSKAAFESGLEQEPMSKQLKESLDEVNEAIAKEELMNEPVVGIDLGTTFSCVAVWKDGKATVLPNTSGNLTTPSWVAFTDDGRRVVGDAAKSQAAGNTSKTLFNIKRIIGRQFSECRDELKQMPFAVSENPVNHRPLIEVDGRKFQPEQISSMVLEEMKHSAEVAIGRPVTKAVITVPAYFNDAQRRLTKDAGTIAGLDVLRIINEPTAAALAYGLDLKAKNSISQEDDDVVVPATNVLVFDLGGGTFDVSLLNINNGIFEVKATAGDTHLGGEDFDHEISEWVQGEVRKERGKDLFKGNDKATRKLRSACECAKRELSSRQSTVIEVSVDGDDEVSITLSRAQLESICDKTIRRCMDSVDRVLKDAKCQTSDIDEIVLVGGSTRIPRVQQLLSEYFGGKVLCKSVNPDEAVAIGAAIQGAILSGMRSSATDNLLLVDVVPLSLGIELQHKEFGIVVPRNTSIPCRKSHEFTTVEDFQTSVDIRIFEGERCNCEGNHLLGEFTINGIERAKKGIAKVEVCFDLNANGLLTVTAQDKVTGAKANVEVHHDIGRLSPEEIKVMQEEAAKFRREDERRAREAERRADREARLDDDLEA